MDCLASTPHPAPVKILWMANHPAVPSGYGRQAALHGKALRDMGHEVAFFANFFYDQDPTWEGMSVYLKQDDAFYDGLPDAAEDFGPDLIIVLTDAHMCNIPTYALLRKRGHKVVTYCPVDCEPLSPADYYLLEEADYRLAMSPHALKMMLDANLPSHYLPHAIDCDFYQIRPDARKPCDGWLFGMVQANVGTRKLIATQLEAFKLVTEKVPDSYLYLHADVTGKTHAYGHDYRPLIRYFGLENRVFGPPTDDYDPHDAMVHHYNVMDLLIHCTAGEGFGVPIIEARACGTPALLNDFSAMRYLPGIHIQPAIRDYIQMLSSWYALPSPEDIADKMVGFTKSSFACRSSVRRDALPYDIRNVAERHWKPFLEEVAHG